LLAKFAFAVASLAPCVAPLAMGSPAISAKSPAELALPAPLRQSRLSLEEALAQRRSLRSFAATHLTLAEVGQLLWAAQGISDAQGRRTAPSAGASYPLTLYLVAGRIDGLRSGVHRYLPQGHKLVMVTGGDVRDAVATAALDQQWLRDAPALIVIAAQPARTAARYGARAEHYVAIEAGAAAQNILLQAVALGLGATLVGAFDAAALRHSVPVVAGEQLLVIVPVGHAR
jgi:SagB-type dehydrogenase family enzyme